LPRPPSIHHCTSEPFRFFGRTAELAVLDQALAGEGPSVVAFVGPGGKGKTAIVQHWLRQMVTGPPGADGVFFWSFYRGKEADLCLAALYAYAEGLAQAPEVSASYCVDHLLPVLRRERWALVLDGAEVAQHESGPWFGRFLHPELGRLLEELASAPLPGVVVLTTRFPVPTLARRRHARVVNLAGLDAASSRALLGSVGVTGSLPELDEAASACGHHAKAVELLGTYLARFHGGAASRHRDLPEAVAVAGASDEEQNVARVLEAFSRALEPEAQDILALATAFRDPPTEARLLEYLGSAPVQGVLHRTWGRRYAPFHERPFGWLASQVQALIDLRLLERVGAASGEVVIDAHPLVRRGFEGVLGPEGQRQGAQARAGFLRGRPDRRPPATLAESLEEVELFHAYCDAGLWNEADTVYVALDNPKHRFLAPAFERDLLLRFFPGGDWRRPPLWPGFGRYRSLAICFELLGRFADALEAYRDADYALRGDALLALGRLEPLLAQPQVAPPWQTLWRAYRAHALSVAGRHAEAMALVRALVPIDVYEWVHVFECLLRTGQLDALDVRSLAYRPPLGTEHPWSLLARERMQADYRRLTASPPPADLGHRYTVLLEAYDRGGLAYERALTRLGYARWLISTGQPELARSVNGTTLDLARRYQMRILEAEAWEIARDVARALKEASERERAANEARGLRQAGGYHGPPRR
jgi:tetratricopeptide (TPR) repeat protein